MRVLERDRRNYGFDYITNIYINVIIIYVYFIMMFLKYININDKIIT